MLIVTILWVVLAATAILLATLRKSVSGQPHAEGQSRESGSALMALAVVYGLALLVGFVYVSKLLLASF